MMRRVAPFLLLVFVWAAFLMNRKPAWAFTSLDSRTYSATVTIGGALPPPLLSIQANPLPPQAFFGKNVVIPVTVTATPGPLDTSGLTVSMEYQLISPSGGALAPVPVQVTFPAVTGPTNTLTGTAIISVSDLQPIRNGGQLYYIFVARQNGAGVLFGAGGHAPAPSGFATLVSSSSFLTAITNTICIPVGPSGPPSVSAPDLFENDGQTSVVLGAGAVSGMGTLCITQDDTSGWPVGPGGAQPLSVYTITLDGASLTRSVPLALSYPTDTSGKILGQNVNAGDLAIFWLGPENLPTPDQQWYILSRANVDPTFHTVTGTTSHFSNFALFAPGASASAASTRPATRIITPNGDGINDIAQFASDVDEVKIFDVRGRRVKTIHGPSPFWDGTDDDGKTVESGVYIYQYSEQGERVSGVIAVAK